MAIFFPETCRKVVGDGSVPPQKWNSCYTNMKIEGKVPYGKRKEVAQTRQIRFPNPFGTIVLLLQRECGFALLYNSILCCTFYAALSLIPSQFKKIYHFNDLQNALCYIPFGIVSMIAAFSRGHVLNSNLSRQAKRLGITTQKNRQTDLAGFPIERARIEIALPTILVGSACMIGFG